MHSNHEWISVEDALPNHCQRVLVVCNNPQNHADMHIGISECYRYVGRPVYWSRRYHVTHWMPLPDMPEETRKGEKK